jgi:SAM-dependent methyltransferase
MAALRASLAAGLLSAAARALCQDPGVVADVPYLASPPGVVDEMLRIAGVGPGDVVYDLGSGEGRIVIAAAKKFGARAVGVEIDPAMVAASRASILREGLAHRASIIHQDIFAADLSAASVVTLYLAPHLNLRLRPRLLELRPGTRVVSHSVDLGDWRPDRRTSIRRDVLLWIVPARLAGRWRGDIESTPRKRRLDMEVRQRYQQLELDARLDGRPASAWELRLEGDALAFVLVDDETNLYFSARVLSDEMQGEVARDVGLARSVSPWRARRQTR